LWFPLLIWWTPLCLIRQILTRRFRLYAYSVSFSVTAVSHMKGECNIQNLTENVPFVGTGDQSCIQVLCHSSG
ncbi:hypothetical protein DKN91_00005, partial [Escherichia coli]|nr:hypothetical protein [Escherichia coli]EFO1960309.1 hypothetical protein [Escherichia coli]EFO4178668.1 hypothetical protein [Escherichia coli]EFO4193594.1 hypothetical protein [Escherichia coli]EFO4199569.1 hypothetical protein [Escherichia coli]